MLHSLRLLAAESKIITHPGILKGSLKGDLKGLFQLAYSVPIAREHGDNNGMTRAK